MNIEIKSKNEKQSSSGGFNGEPVTDLDLMAQNEELHKSLRKVGQLRKGLKCKQHPLTILSGRHSHSILREGMQFEEFDVDSFAETLGVSHEAAEQIVIDQCNVQRQAPHDETRRNLIRLAEELERSGVPIHRIATKMQDLVGHDPSFIDKCLPGKYKDSSKARSPGRPPKSKVVFRGKQDAPNSVGTRNDNRDQTSSLADVSTTDAKPGKDQDATTASAVTNREGTAPPAVRDLAGSGSDNSVTIGATVGSPSGAVKRKRYPDTSDLYLRSSVLSFSIARVEIISEEFLSLTEEYAVDPKCALMRRSIKARASILVQGLVQILTDRETYEREKEDARTAVDIFKDDCNQYLQKFGLEIDLV